MYNNGTKVIQIIYKVIPLNKPEINYQALMIADLQTFIFREVSYKKVDINLTLGENKTADLSSNSSNLIKTDNQNKPSTFNTQTIKPNTSSVNSTTKPSENNSSSTQTSNTTQINQNATSNSTQVNPQKDISSSSPSSVNTSLSASNSSVSTSSSGKGI